jgi:TatD DNase family protein
VDTTDLYPVFDSHAHFDISDRQDEKSIYAMIERAQQSAVAGIIAIAGATSVGDYEFTALLARKYEFLFQAAGIHPHCASHATIGELDKLKFALDGPKIVAIGEIGLDYHYNYSAPKEQRNAFIMQLAIARKRGLPVIVHTRDADEDTMAVLDGEGVRETGGVIHCFSSSFKLADFALKNGMYISFSGIVTFSKAAEIQQIAAYVAENKILAETDTPFLSPVPFRGKPNEPLRVRNVVEKLAELRNVKKKEMGRITLENSCKCFNINIDI